MSETIKLNYEAAIGLAQKMDTGAESLLSNQKAIEQHVKNLLSCWSGKSAELMRNDVQTMNKLMAEYHEALKGLADFARKAAEAIYFVEQQNKMASFLGGYPEGSSAKHSYGRASECMGFAFRILAEFHGLGDYSNKWLGGEIKENWKRRDANDVGIGDYVRYNSGSNDHSIVIIDVFTDASGVEKVKYIETGKYYDLKVHYGEMSKEDLKIMVDKSLNWEDSKGYIAYP